jgi:lipopolysaccharide transport system permease protein
MSLTAMQTQRPWVPPALVIEPARGFGAFRPKDLWAFWAFWDYRELLYFLVWRDVKVRYKQTALGAAWAVLQPALGAVVFSLFFGRLAGIGSDGVPYPLFAYAGLMVWTFFSQGVTLAANSLVGSANLITKVFFPRAAIPTAAVLSGLVDLAVAFPVLAVLLLGYRVRPGSALLALPLPLALALASALGAGLWLAALNVEYRDVRHVVPFFLQIWLFLTPVIYPASRVEGWLRQNGVAGGDQPHGRRRRGVPLGAAPAARRSRPAARRLRGQRGAPPALRPRLLPQRRKVVRRCCLTRTW